MLENKENRIPRYCRPLSMVVWDTSSNIHLGSIDFEISSR